MWLTRTSNRFEKDVCDNIKNKKGRKNHSSDSTHMFLCVVYSTYLKNQHEKDEKWLKERNKIKKSFCVSHSVMLNALTLKWTVCYRFVKAKKGPSNGINVKSESPIFCNAFSSKIWSDVLRICQFNRTVVLDDIFQKMFSGNSNLFDIWL